MVVDYFARYQIKDPLLFYQSVRTSELLDQRLKPIITSASTSASASSAEICR